MTTIAMQRTASAPSTALAPRLLLTLSPRRSLPSLRMGHTVSASTPAVVAHPSHAPYGNNTPTTPTSTPAAVAHPSHAPYGNNTPTTPTSTPAAVAHPSHSLYSNTAAPPPTHNNNPPSSDNPSTAPLVPHARHTSPSLLRRLLQGPRFRTTLLSANSTSRSPQTWLKEARKRIYISLGISTAFAVGCLGIAIATSKSDSVIIRVSMIFAAILSIFASIILVISCLLFPVIERWPHTWAGRLNATVQLSNCLLLLSFTSGLVAGTCDALELNRVFGIAVATAGALVVMIAVVLLLG